MTKKQRETDPDKRLARLMQKAIRDEFQPMRESLDSIKGMLAGAEIRTATLTVGLQAGVTASTSLEGAVDIGLDLTDDLREAGSKVALDRMKKETRLVVPASTMPPLPEVPHGS